MNISLINTPYSRLYGPMGSGGNYQYPLGLGYISASLKRAGHDCEIIDLEVLGWSTLELIWQLRARRPVLVGVSTATPNYPLAQEIARAVRAALPVAGLVLGGVHASALPGEVLAETPEIDLVVVGEGEQTMVELAARWPGRLAVRRGALSDLPGLALRTETGVELTSPRTFRVDLDGLPHPDRGAASSAKYRPQAYADVGLPSASMITSRGCPHRCVFCASGVSMGKKFRAHSPEYIVKEMEELWRVHGVRHFVFKDDTFTMDSDRVERFCRLVSKRLPEVSWFCYARADRVSRELLALMAGAGLSVISFGLESGDDLSLRRLGKGHSVERGLAAVEWARQEGVFVIASYILGTPAEEEVAARRTINCAKRGNPHLASFNRLVVYPGTTLYQERSHSGRLSGDWQDFVPTGPRLAANLSRISDKGLNDITRAAYRVFYLRPAKIFDIITNIRGWRHFGVFVRAAFGFLRQLWWWRSSR